MIHRTEEERIRQDHALALEQDAAAHESVIGSFLGALGARSTYAPWKNAYALFGFLWGLPVPITASLIALHGKGIPITWEAFGRGLHYAPWPVLWLLHPLFFLVVFGALGTIARRRQERIGELLGRLREECGVLEGDRERLTNLGRAKDSLFGEIAHDLRTPLVTIRGYTEWILEGRMGSVSDEARRALEIELRNIQKILRLVNNLVRIGKLAEGGWVPRRAPFDAADMLRHCQQDFRIDADEARVSIRVEAPQSGVPAAADRPLVEEAVENLVANALRHAPPGSVIALRARRTERGAEIAVADGGPGMPPEILARLGNGGTEADLLSLRGRGLGLVIVRRIAKAHGGEIRAESRPGEGTTVTLDLPDRPGPDPAPAREDEREADRGAEKAPCACGG